jgi:hypothetical protein
MIHIHFRRDFRHFRWTMDRFRFRVTSPILKSRVPTIRSIFTRKPTFFSAIRGDLAGTCDFVAVRYGLARLGFRIAHYQITKLPVVIRKTTVIAFKPRLEIRIHPIQSDLPRLCAIQTRLDPGPQEEVPKTRLVLGFSPRNHAFAQTPATEQVIPVYEVDIDNLS